MNYQFGKWTSATELTTEDIEAVLQQASQQQDVLFETPIESILSVIAKVGELWKPGQKYYELALQTLPQEVSFSVAMIQKTLDIVPVLCSESVLRQRILANFGSLEVLDQMTRREGFDGRVQAIPFGTLLHVSAGNVFIGCIDSLIQGFLTKNISILKLSGRNTRFPELFAQSIVEADSQAVLAKSFAMLNWSGGSSKIESLLKEKVNAIIAWGGPDMIRSYRDGLGSGVSLIEHGPKISFQILFKDAFAKANIDSLAQNIADDVAAWDQSACASPQNLFVQEGIDVSLLLVKIQEALDQKTLARGELSPDEEVEILKEKAMAEYSELMEGGRLQIGKTSLLWMDSQPGLRASPLNRTLILKSFKDLTDLKSQVAPHSDVLQSCGYLACGADREQLLRKGGQWGIQRFAPVGQMMTGIEGGPHDGRYPLAELIRWVSDENPDHSNSVQTKKLIGFVNDTIQNVPFYHDLYKGQTLSSVNELKSLSASIFSEPQEAHRLIRRELQPGFTFSSGGTTGNPKFINYAYSEFEKVGALLARGFRAQGIGPGTLCANLFVAGNLWSSFLAVESALRHCQAPQLPIGGLAEPDLVLSYLSKFQPQVVLGLPSLMLSLANRSQEKGIQLKMKTLCYAGEHLNPQARKLLAEQWGVENFFSAGYASVDAGPIGYQCAHNKGGEHHLLADAVHLEIIDGEGVVTSLVRKNMPIIHLRTGDHLEWLESSGACACGSSDPRFILHGRCDGQMNIWSSRVPLEDIEKALEIAQISEATYQILLKEFKINDQLTETLTLRIETDKAISPLKKDLFAQALYEVNMDLRTTHQLDFVSQRCALELVTPGTLKRIPRTGKLPPVLDHRR